MFKQTKTAGFPYSKRRISSFSPIIITQEIIDFGIILLFRKWRNAHIDFTNLFSP